MNMQASSSKDKWDIIEIFTRPAAALLTALAVGAIGYFGNDAITKATQIQEDARTKIAEHEQNARLYTELLSRREESESSLRKDMFNTIMGGFFADIKEDDVTNGISKKLLKLEMLALNFGDSLSLGPLFNEMSQDIERILESNNIKDWKFVAGDYQKRLRGLAKRVASAQLATIVPKGIAFKFNVPYEKIKKPKSESSINWQYIWPEDYEPDDGTEAQENIFKIGNMPRSITIQLKNAVLRDKSVKINLVIEGLDKEKSKSDPVEIPFTLDYFNFPLIDNTRLSENERFAIVLDDFNENEVTIKGVLFPGVYASQRDKPFLNEAIQDLKIQQVLPDSGDESSTISSERMADEARTAEE